MSNPVPVKKNPWPWIIAGASALIAITLLVVLLLTRGVDTTTPPPPTPLPTGSASPTAASPSPTPDAPSDTFSADDSLNVQESISSDNTAALEQYLADPVQVVFAASEFAGPRTAVEAIGDLEYVHDSTGWNWNLDAATLASYRAGFYGDYFPAGAIIGQSAEGQVISFTVTGTEITTIFVAGSPDLLIG